MESALQDLPEAADCIEGEARPPNLMRHVLPISTHELEAMRRKLAEDMERTLQKFKEFFEKIGAEKDALLAQIEQFMEQALHRSQGRTSGTGKAPAKKHASSGTGGGGDGDGDGPHRTRTKQQRRSSSKRNNPSQRPPNVRQGAIATTSSPQSQPPTPSQGHGLIAFIATILLVFVFVLLEKEEREMAWAVLSPVIVALTSYLKPPSKKR